jgi:hypothetical protein
MASISGQGNEVGVADARVGPRTKTRKIIQIIMGANRSVVDDDNDCEHENTIDLMNFTLQPALLEELVRFLVLDMFSFIFSFFLA